MIKRLSIFLIVSAFTYCAEEEPPTGEVANTFEGFETPESVAQGPDGRYYVSNIGGFNVNDDGTIKVIDGDSIHVFADGLDDPKGLAFHDGDLYVTDKTKIWRIDTNGNKEIFVDSTAFPATPKFLNDTVFDTQGNLYVSDSGTFDQMDGAIYRVAPDGTVSLVIDHQASPEIAAPNGLIFDKTGNLLVVDLHTGKLMRVDEAGPAVDVLHEGFGAGDGLAYDHQGNLYVSDWQGGKIFRVDQEGNVSEFMTGFQASADIFIDQQKHTMLVPEFNGGAVAVVKLR